MSANVQPRPPGIVMIGLVVAAIVLIPLYPRIARFVAETGVHPHGPDLALWAAQPPVIQVHVLAAVAAFALGLVLFALRKGRATHKALGWAWVALMSVTAGSSLLITGLNGDHYSLIHGLTGFTLVMLPLGVYAIKRKEVLRHRRIMTGLFMGGLVVAGLFTFVPGRLMWNLFFGA